MLGTWVRRSLDLGVRRRTKATLNLFKIVSKEFDTSQCQDSIELAYSRHYDRKIQESAYYVSGEGALLYIWDELVMRATRNWGNSPVSYEINELTTYLVAVSCLLQRYLIYIDAKY